MSTFTIKFETEESFLNALLHFNDVCNIPPSNFNKELKSMSYEILDGIDDQVVELVKEELTNVPHIQDYSFIEEK